MKSVDRSGPEWTVRGLDHWNGPLEWIIVLLDRAHAQKTNCSAKWVRPIPQLVAVPYANYLTCQ